MRTFKSPALLLGGIAIIGLTGCEKLEQAAAEAVEQARQSATQAIDEVRQAGSLEEATQAATRALEAARQNAAGLLDQTRQQLSEDGQAPADEIPASGDSPAAM